MEKEKILKKVLAKLDLYKFYMSEEVQDLINKGTDLFPDYNTDYEEAEKVRDFVFKNIEPKYRTKKLSDGILSGIT